VDCNRLILYLRSLTKRQRQLLQAYADNVEGRLEETPQSSPEEQVSKSNDRETDNGTGSFTPPSPSGGRVSRTWNKIRELIGF